MCLTPSLGSSVGRRLLGQPKGLCKRSRASWSTADEFKAWAGKQFQAGGLFVNLLSRLHNRSTQSTNRNPQCSRLGSFKMEQQIGKKNRLQYWAWIFKITNKGVVQLLSQKVLLKPPRVPRQLSVIMCNWELCIPRLCFLDAIEEIYQYVPFFFLLFFFLSFSGSCLSVFCRVSWLFPRTVARGPSHVPYCLHQYHVPYCYTKIPICIFTSLSCQKYLKQTKKKNPKD